MARIGRAQSALAAAECDALLVMDRENLIYFTGIPEIECGGLLVPRSGDPVLVTLWLDLPYIDDLGYEVRGYVFRSQSLADAMVEQIRERGLSSPRLAFTRYFVDVAVFKALESQLPGMTVVDGGELCYRVRSVKDPEEIQAVRRASDIVSAGMEAAVAAVKPGITEVEVLGHAELAMRQAGSEGSPFRMQVLTPERQLMVHPFAGGGLLEEGQTVVIHLGASWRGYVSKMCRTVALGRAQARTVEIFDVLRTARDAAVSACRPGVTGHEVDRAARDVVEAAGLGHGMVADIGYGIGIRQSEFFPVLGRDRDHVLEHGMTVDLMFPTLFVPHGGPRLTDAFLVGDPSEQLTEFPQELICK